MERNTYNTKQKQNILDVLKDNSSTSLPSSKILEILNKNNMAVSRATLYRFLDILVSEGIVRKFYSDEIDGFEYQYLSIDKECNEHLHLKCKVCGNIFHLDCEDAMHFINHIKEKHGFLVSAKDTIIYGTCKNCLQDKGE